VPKVGDRVIPPGSETIYEVFGDAGSERYESDGDYAHCKKDSPRRTCSAMPRLKPAISKSCRLFLALGGDAQGLELL
jgi:hypothetical protein